MPNVVRYFMDALAALHCVLGINKGEEEIWLFFAGDEILALIFKSFDDDAAHQVGSIYF